MIVYPFPCSRQCIQQPYVLQGLQLTPRQHSLPDHFRVVVGAAEFISEVHRVPQWQLFPVYRGVHLWGHPLDM